MKPSKNCNDKDILMTISRMREDGGLVSILIACPAYNATTALAASGNL